MKAITETDLSFNENIYRWKDHFFSSQTDIYKGDRKVGSLRQRCFRREISASILGERIVFRSQGLFSRNVAIWKASTKQKVGEIRFQTWGCGSEIMLDEGKKKYQWKYSNLWNTRWELSYENKRVLYSKSTFGKGKTKSYTQKIDPILLLSAYYVYSRYRQQSYALVVFLPIIAVASG